MSNWDEFDGDDLHADPGDDGRVNANSDDEIPLLEIISRAENGDDDEPFDPWPGDLQMLYPDLFALLGETNLSTFDIGFDPETGFPSQDRAIGGGAEVRGTVFSTPEDALRAIIDGGITAFAFIVQFGDEEFGIGVLYGSNQ